MGEGRRWSGDLEEVREAGNLTMVNTTAPIAPFIHGFTPVNPRPALEESDSAQHATLREKTPGKLKRARKPADSAPRANRKRKNSQLPGSMPAKKSKNSNSRGDPENYDISKNLHRTKPGFAQDALPNTPKANRNLPLSFLRIPSSEPAICENSIASGRQEVEPIPAASVKSGKSSLGKAYQSTFIETSKGNENGDQHQSSSAKPLSRVRNFEAIMGDRMDDDSFFTCSEGRPKQYSADLAQWSSSHNTLLGDDTKCDQGVDLCLPSEERLRRYERSSSFGEALEQDAPLETDNSRISSSAVDQATIDRFVSREAQPTFYDQKPVSTLTDAVQNKSSRAPGSLTTESTRDEMESEDTDEFPVHEDDFPIWDEQECLESEHYGEKLPKPDAADSLACDGPDLIAPDPFADEDLDADLMNMSTVVSERIPGQSPPLTQTTPPRTELQWTPPKPYTLSKPAQKSNATIHNSNAVFITPRMPLSALSPNTGTQFISPSKDGQPLPFIRPSFPLAILPRSHVPGLASNTFLRTCFRIGEALNAACIAFRNSKDAVVELYCRIKYSDREANGYKQFFELTDLFTPEKPPSLNGVYTIWKGVDLWNYDSKLLLGARGRGKMARILGRIRRGKDNQGWEMTMLNVWEATWEVGFNLIPVQEWRY